MIKRLRLLCIPAFLFMSTVVDAQNCAAYFDGVAAKAYVISDSVSIKNFTIALWFKAYGPGPMFSSSQDSNGLTGVGDKRLWIDATGTLYGGIYGGGVHAINSNTKVLDSACHFAALTQSDTSIELFLDGVYKGSSPFVSSDQTSLPPFCWVVGHEYMIGDWQPQPPTYFFKGYIDELTIWNKRFTPTGVADTLMQLNYPTGDTSFLWHFTFNNCSNAYTVSSARFTDTLHYQSGVQAVNSNCPVSSELITGPVASSPFCAGITLAVPYTSTATFTSGNIFTIQLSDSNGNFGSPVNIGDSASVAASGAILVAIPAGTPSGMKYRVRVISSSPSIIGTIDTSALTISAKLNASVSISASSLNICSGSADTFTATGVNGGTPVYRWIKNGIDVGTDASGYTDSALQNGDVLSCMMISTAGCVSPDTAFSNQLLLSVKNAQAGIIMALKDTVCQGTTVQLSVTGAVDSLLQWQSSALQGGFTDIPDANIIIYSTPAVQSMAFRIVVANGNCMDTSAPFNLVVNPVPASPHISASDTLICSSDSARINAPGGFAGYLWSTGDTTTYTEAKSAGGYWVTVTDANGCTVVSSHINVDVYPVPSVSIVVQGDTLASFNAITYQWFLNDHLIQGATSNVYIVKETGDYSVQVTDSNGCTTVSTKTPIVISGLQDLNVNGRWKVYPNPAATEVYISLTGENGPAAIRILNTIGQQIKMQPVAPGKDNLIPIDISDLPPGVYELIFWQDEEVFECSLVKQ